MKFKVVLSLCVCVCVTGSGPGDLRRCDVLRHDAAAGSAQAFAPPAYIPARHHQAPPSGVALRLRVTRPSPLPATQSQTHSDPTAAGEHMSSPVTGGIKLVKLLFYLITFQVL